MKAPQKSLKDWTKQKWRTKSGKPSAKTGERYLPEAAIKSLSSAEYAATTKAKREGKAKGKQFVKQPKKIAEKTRKFRASEGGVAMTKERSTKPGARAGSSKNIDLEKNKKYGIIRDESGFMPRINPVTGKEESPMSLKKSVDEKQRQIKEKEKLKKMDKVGIIKLIQAESKKNPMAFAKKAGKSKTKEKLEKMNKNGLINFIMDLKSKMKTGKKVPERLKANKGGMMKKKGYAAGGLKTPGANQKGLKKLPKAVRNKMGYMNKGGMPKKKGYAKGGKMVDMRKTGMFYGGMSRRGK